jgi:methylmalonyl-CoA decarboxylase
VNEIVPADQLEQFTADLAKLIASRSLQSIAAFKEQARIILSSGSISPEVFEYIEEIRRQVYHGSDYNEGVKAFIEKRAPNFN